MTRLMSTTRTTIVAAVLAVLAVVVALTPRIVSGVILTIAVIVAFTVWAWRRAGKTSGATRRMVIPLYGGLFSFIAAGTGVIMWTTALGDYHLCLDRVDRSEKAYESTKLLYDVIDAVTHTDHYTADVFVPGKPSLRASLLQPLTNAGCEKYRP